MKQLRQSHHQSGFSLIELILAGTIAVAVLITFTNLLINNINTRSASQTYSQLQKSGDYITTDISNTIRWAQAISLTTSTNQLQIVDATGDSITYTYDGTTITRNNTSTSQTNPLNNENYVVSYYQINAIPSNNPTSLQLILTIQEVRSPHRETEYSTTITTRKTGITQI